MLPADELEHLVVKLDLQDVNASFLLEVVLVAGVMPVMGTDQGMLIERLLPQEVCGIVLE